MQGGLEAGCAGWANSGQTTKLGPGGQIRAMRTTIGPARQALKFRPAQQIRAGQEYSNRSSRSQDGLVKSRQANQYPVLQKTRWCLSQRSSVAFVWLPIWAPPSWARLSDPLFDDWLPLLFRLAPILTLLAPIFAGPNFRWPQFSLAQIFAGPKF